MGLRISFYIVGLLVVTLGASLLILSDVGAGPWDTAYVGLSNTVGLTTGTWSIITFCIFLLFAAVLDKKRPEFESIIAILLFGLSLDFWLEIILKDVSLSAAALLTKWIFFMLGIIIVGLGAGTYITSNLPKLPGESLMFAIRNRFRLSIGFSRFLLEITGGAIGFLLGGPVGLGTLIICFTLGYFIQYFHQAASRLYNYLAKKNVDTKQKLDVS